MRAYSSQGSRIGLHETKYDKCFGKIGIVYSIIPCLLIIQ